MITPFFSQKERCREYYRLAKLKKKEGKLGNIISTRGECIKKI